MQTKKLTLGEICLDKYMSDKVGVEKEKIEEINKLIENLGGSEANKALKTEKLPLELLLEQRAKYTYPRLDLSFLAASSIINYKNLDIKVPKFSVYELYGDNCFYLSIMTWGVIRSRATVRIRKDEEGNGNLPKIFNAQLLKSLEFSEYSDPKREYSYGDVHYSFNVPRQIKKKYIGLGDIEFISQFHGVLPEKTKEKAAQAEKNFRREDLYLIAETKLEQWQNNEFVKDSLLIGLYNNKCYLIDYFNPVSIEDYVKEKFR